MSRNVVNIFIVCGFFIFSSWLMFKSFGYEDGVFRIARHQVGDFGLHLSLIRSFSWGNNFPPESPFYPGKPLPYHYGLDLLVGLLERTGLRIDIALNGVSVLFFTLLLYLIYRFSQLLFGQNILLGLLSVALFLFPSTLTFVDFFKNYSLTDVWSLSDYVHKGPFDGSVISLFFTLNPFLNQRHLIIGLTIALAVISYVVSKFLKNKKYSLKELFLLGAALGLSTRIHSLVAIGTALSLLPLLRSMRNIFILLGSFSFFVIPHLQIADLKHNYFNPGYLVERPLALFNIIRFWWMNIGLSLILIPLGYFFASRKQRIIFFSFLPLFLIANFFQLSYRIEHNHSLITLFLVVANMFSVAFLVRLWKKSTFVVLLSCFVLFSSGILNLMAVKNDYQYKVLDAPKSGLIEWIAKATPKSSIFLAKQDLYDPVTLAGRKNYLGPDYYLEVMGYDTASRKKLVRQFFEAKSNETIDVMRNEGIDYIIVTAETDRVLFQSTLKVTYQDDKVIVYSL